MPPPLHAHDEHRERVEDRGRMTAPSVSKRSERMKVMDGLKAEAGELMTGNDGGAAARVQIMVLRLTKLMSELEDDMTRQRCEMERRESALTEKQSVVDSLRDDSERNRELDLERRELDLGRRELESQRRELEVQRGEAALKQRELQLENEARGRENALREQHNTRVLAWREEKLEERKKAADQANTGRQVELDRKKEADEVKLARRAERADAVDRDLAAQRAALNERSEGLEEMSREAKRLNKNNRELVSKAEEENRQAGDREREAHQQREEAERLKSQQESLLAWIFPDGIDSLEKQNRERGREIDSLRNQLNAMRLENEGLRRTQADGDGTRDSQSLRGAKRRRGALTEAEDASASPRFGGDGLRLGGRQTNEHNGPGGRSGNDNARLPEHSPAEEGSSRRPNVSTSANRQGASVRKPKVGRAVDLQTSSDTTMHTVSELLDQLEIFVDDKGTRAAARDLDDAVIDAITPQLERYLAHKTWHNLFQRTRAGIAKCGTNRSYNNSGCPEMRDCLACEYCQDTGQLCIHVQADTRPCIAPRLPDQRQGMRPDQVEWWIPVEFEEIK
ncbi:hypothetical protein KC367_g1629 [Hortaea werneckii]|nr:hypothetical protein KC357_g3427 [Hortaea werneckii]KAI7503502.1 hypothetical protein KC367_g1629 [Hortaea werneckii]